MIGRVSLNALAGMVFALLTVAVAEEARALPYLDSLSPVSGPTTGGTGVYLYGSGFSSSGTTRVIFGGVDATNVHVYSSGYGNLYIYCATPAHAAGAVDVTVINPYSGGSSTRVNGFTYVVPPPPNPTSISPATGRSTGGTAVNISGTGFSSYGTTRVAFGGVEATNVHVYSSGYGGPYISCTTPPHAVGMVDVVVTNGDGQSATCTGWYTYTVSPPPNPTAITPVQGYSDGGDLVYVDGWDFSRYVTTQVTFDGVLGTSFYVYDAGSGKIRIRCLTPPHPAGTVDVTVTSSDGGSGTLSGTLSGGFTYLDPPTPNPTAILPDQGYTYGDDSIIINGTGFTPSRPPCVTFGGVDAGTTTVQDTGEGYMQIYCSSPAHAVGTVDVVVTGPGGLSGTLPAAFTYLAPPKPAPASVTPATGLTTGGTNVTIRGSGFSRDGVSQVYFGGVKATNVWLNTPATGDSYVTCTTPTHLAGAVDVMVVNFDGQSGTLSNGFTYTPAPAPTLTVIAPATGPSLGGTTVTINGTNFTQSGTTRVTFGGAEATSVQLVNAGYGNLYITCRTPVHAAGAVDVTVINPTGESGTRSGGFTYTQAPAPTLSTRNPATGLSTGGTSVNISGGGFSQYGTTRVAFDGVDATGVRVISGGYGGLYVTCVTPAHAAGDVDVTVINPDGQSTTRTAWFTYTAAPAPTLGSLSPASGATAGGAPVTVNGTGFSPYGTTRVTFDGIDATEVLVSSPIAVTCRTPAHALGAVGVTVVNGDGQSGTLEYGFTYSAPQVTGVAPAAGPAEGGTPVTVSGTCFAASGVRVLFGDAEAAAVTVSGGDISCILPPHAAGVVDVTVINPDDSAGTSPAAFTYRTPGEIVVRVDADNISGVEDGSAWATAFPTIQQGIDAVVASGQTGEVWVAEGTYTADTSGTVVATMASFCDLYGGFAGVETRREQRDIAAHAAIIDGLGESACVYGADTARLDGFTITRGNGPFRLGNQSSWADLFVSVTTSPPPGFAVDNSGVSPTIAHCTFTNNNATAAVINFAEEAAPSSPLITGCTFSNNGSAMGNGSLAGMVSKSRLDNCLFTGNSAGVQDIAWEGECSPTITRCAFRANGTGYTAAAWTGISAARLENCEFSQCSSRTVYLYGPTSSLLLTPVFTNCTFAGNTATREVFYSSGVAAQVELRNCIVWGNTGPLLGAAGGLVTLTASHSDIQGGYAGTGNLNVDPLFEGLGCAISSASPCVDAGTAIGAPTTDILGVFRPQGAGFDMGAYEAGVPVTVPELHGLTPAAAWDLVTAANLSLGEETEEYDSTVPAGHVAGQTPAAGAQVPQQTPVDLVLSLGPPPPVPVPDVVGMVQEAADAALSDAGLLLGTVTREYSLTVPAGTVISQNPAAGAEAFAGTPVDLVVSRGGIAVPGVAGLTQGSASNALTGAGLVVGTVTQEYSLTVASGKVISQSVAAGTQVLPGELVDLVVSLGGIAVPDVVGASQSAAATVLTGAQLVVGTISEQYSVTVPVGAVAAQTPAAGTPVLPGTAVDLALSRGGIDVPGVAGLTQGSASNVLTAAGFRVGTVTQEHSLTVASGTVISQSPAAGAQALPGAAIDLVVSSGGIAAPNVVGQTQSAAATAITGAQLVVGAVTQAYSLTVPAGTVIAQTPATGTPMLPGAAVDLVVSRGGIAVPNLVSGTQTAATATLTGAQLVVGTVTQQHSLIVAIGHVISQSVASGTQVLPGTAVDLVVSCGGITVPNVTGKTRTDAAFYVNNSRLVVGTVTEEYSLTVPAGVVISQSIAAGTQVLPGEVIDLVVSKGGIAVPNVAGASQSAAASAITGAQLAVGTVTQEYSLTVAVGNVISQSVAAGAQVLPGAVIDLVVSRGGIAVPNLAGQAQSAAASAITGAQLAVGTVTQEYSLTVAAGNVISQSVAAGTPVLPGAAIDLVVSRGGIAVPDVAGQTHSAAVMAITGAQLAIGSVTEQYSVTVPAGSVISQSIVAGTQVLPGTAVGLVVSRGGIVVPDVVGQTQGAAATAITGAQCVVGTVTQQYSLTVPAGAVISQSPLAGTLAPTGAAINLLVSRGGIAVPDVAGQTQEAASSLLTNAGLAVGAVAQQYSATVPAGSVISQTPAAGTFVLPGTAVNLAVSRGAQPVVVPDVAGQPQAQAEAALSGAGLAPGAVTREHSNSVPAGRVISQQPAAGTELPPGTAVSLVVSLGPAPIVEGEGEVPNAETAKQELADVYDSADTNSDGTLSFGEASAAVPGLTQAVFDELDASGDGQLGAAELGLEDGSGCAGCRGGKGAVTPADMGKRMGDLFLTGLGLLGLTAMVMLRHK